MSFSDPDTVLPLPLTGQGISAIPAWQERGLDRSLGDTRTRSVQRMDALVDAARTLAATTGDANFTVQQVVADANQSLKSFYRYFRGKDDLLLALIEQDCAVGAVFLSELVDRHRPPADRVRAWVIGLFDLMAAGATGYVSVLLREHQRLRQTRPQEMERALSPFIDFLAAELAMAMAEGAVRHGDPDRDARMVFQLVLAEIQELVLGRYAPASPDVEADTSTPPKRRAPTIVNTSIDVARSARIADSADYVWRFCLGGLGPSNDHYSPHNHVPQGET